jgi:NarL family two-component system response regulator LiaR
LVLTSYGEESNVSAAIKAGALGYLLKTSSAEELFHSIRGVAMGSLSLAPEVAQALKLNLQQPSGTPLPPIPELTEREVEVLQGIAQGLSNQAIADELQIEKSTVRSHISSILNKLGMTNRTQAALYAVEIGLGRVKE